MTPTLNQIEQKIDQLSQIEKLQLIEKLAHSLHDKISGQEFSEHQLSAMANDTDIQREIKTINSEFAITENDGL